MIIYNLANFILNIMIALFNGLEIPPFPDPVAEGLQFIFDLFSVGFSILGVFFDMSYIVILFELVIGIEFIFLTYNSVMFIIKKIPFLGIK